MCLMAFSDEEMVSPLPEIQAADEPTNLVERCDSIPLHAFPLPLPSDHWEKACGDVGDDEIEPALYKKVIYIPDTTEPFSRGKGNRNYRKKEAPSPSAPLDCCEWSPGEILKEQRNEQRKNRSSSCREKVCHRWHSRHRDWEWLANYKREWKCRFKFEVIVAAHYLFWENMVWGILMGAWLQHQTRGKVGSVEVFSSNFLCGTAFVLLGGQALLIVGVAAPAVIFIVAVSDAADRLSIEFLPWMGWVGIWSSVVLLILSASGACRYTTTTITSFTWEAIQVFVGMIFIWNAVEEMLQFFSKHVNLDSSMLSLWLATSSFVVAAFLSQAGRSGLLNRKLCRVVSNCALPMALLLFTGMTFLPKLSHPQLQRVSFPSTGFRTDGTTELGSLVRLRRVPMWTIFLAIIPGSLLASMIFLDHNAASLFIQGKASLNMNGSRSGSWDVFIIALLVLVCGLLGLPFCHGLILQSLKHVHVLTRYENSDLENQEGWRNEINVQRISGLIASLLSGLPLVPGSNWIMGKIPFAVTAGLFLEVALQTFKYLHFTEYMKLILTDSSLQSVPSRSIRAVREYSFIQFACTLIIFAISKTPAALLFPLVFPLMVWLRHCPLSGVFTLQGLDKLDLKLLNDNPNTAMTDISTASRAGACIQPPFPSTNRHIRGRGKATGCESPLPWKNPTILATASARRLKERRLRRKKRERPASVNGSDQHEMHGDLHTVVLPLPCRYQLKGISSSPATREEPCTSFSASAIGRQLSPHFLKWKKNSGLQNAIEMHSNILYDPGWDGPAVPPLLCPEAQEIRIPGEPINEWDATRTTMKMKMVKQYGVGSFDSRPPSSSSSSPSPWSSLSQNHNGIAENLSNDNNNLAKKRKKKEGVDSAGLRGMSPSKHKHKHDVYPYTPYLKTTIETRTKQGDGHVGRSRRNRMILNQTVWPSNKPMQRIKQISSPRARSNDNLSHKNLRLI